MAQTKEEIAAYHHAWYIAHREGQLAAKKKRDEQKQTTRKIEKPLRTPEETAARKHAWYLANREAIRAKRKADNASPKNREKQRVRWAAYRTANREKIAAKDRVYRAANRDRRREYDKNREVQKRTNGGTYTKAEWRALRDWFGNVCLCCGSGDNLTADHVIPLAKGGRNDIVNLQPLCISCNSLKLQDETDYRDPQQLAAFLTQLN